MQRVNMISMFETPDFYKPPALDQLPACTQYPNLNSREYQTRPPAETSRNRKFFEHLAVNGVGQAVLVANRYTDRVWHGHFWGFERLTDVHGDVQDAVTVQPSNQAGEKTKTAVRVSSDGASYRMRCKASVSGIQYVEDNMLVVADTAGTLALWSTQAAVRSPSDYNLFNIGNQSEHTGSITALAVCTAKRTAVLTGSSDGCVKCWDLGDGDLCSAQTYRSAHVGAITGLAASPAVHEMFASCSLDGSLLLWDQRVSQQRPVVAAIKPSAVGLTAVQWCDRSAGTDRVYVGDESGAVHRLDVRQPGECERTWRPFDDSGERAGRVHRMRLSGDRTQRQLLAVVADSTVVKVLDVGGGGGAAAGDKVDSVVLVTPPAADYVRDVHWGEAGQLYTVGWGAALSATAVVAGGTRNGLLV